MSGTCQLSRSRGGSSNSRAAHMQDYGVTPTTNTMTMSRYFEPCAATASMFLYAQGSSVVCSHHDTLTIERRFARHSEEVQILAVDNQSELGAGRLVVSYDAGQTAIVWDLLTGEEVARFASYENLTCAAWMRNGNVAFGNVQGSVILFEPTTSEHISARTIDQIAITAIAPAADCRTFAIGYQNGSCLIVTLQPRFTILHNLSTSRAPSPIVTLAWHASSARQKSDMLAVQTNDGDLRVWSVSKSYNAEDPAKVVRILKKTEDARTGPNWMGWSKNGRIIQHSESETISWDVRTKHVTFDPIPTLENVRGLAVYGPGASLFTLGANNTVQQFDLNSPAMMVANVQHPANLLPPSPPISLEADDKTQNSSLSESESSVQIAIHAELSEEEGDHMSPLARLVKGEPDADIDKYRTMSPVSSRSRSSVSISSSSSQTPARGNYPASAVSRSMTENTYISTGSSLQSSVAPYNNNQRDRRERDSYSTSSSISMSSASQYRSRHKPSRLRNEVPRSPEDSKVVDLFKFTKSRLTDVPFKAPYTGGAHLTNDDLRRQMLSSVFGWNKEVDDLIRDEMSRHPLGSTSRILLAKWLGDISTDIMEMGSENMTSSDWMLLALSGIGGQASQHKLGRAYVQRLLESGDVHAAATIMIGLGDHNDAIEIYISHKRYMEALLLTCLFFPATWERQEAIVKKWGEWAVQHGQRELAIRCFACTGRESSDPWTSPSAQQITFPSIGQNMSDLLSPPMSPPSMSLGPQRSVAKNASLKLITSFGGPQAKAKFFAGDDGKTPIAAGVTPILDSALSPGGHGEPATAVLRPGNRSQFATPASARPVQGFNRGRLPSIGETPADHSRDLLTAIEMGPRDPYAALHIQKQKPAEYHDLPSKPQTLDVPRASTASPMMMKGGSRKPQPPPSPSPAAVAALMETSKRRNGSRTRIPEGLDLSLPVFNESMHDEVTSPDQSVASSARYHWPSRRRGPGSVASSATSASAASSVANSVASRHRGHHQQGKSLDDYIHSIEGSQSSRHGTQRATSRDGRRRGREHSRSRRTDRDDESQDRGRGSSRGYTPKGGKRSPKSPVPMSPEDLINLATPREDEMQMQERHEREGQPPLIDVSSHDEPEQPSTVKKMTDSRRETSRARASSRATSRTRRGESREGRRGESRHRSPDRLAERRGNRQPPALELRGRSSTREGSMMRSPSSPLPMAAAAQQYSNSEDEEDYRQALQAKEKFRRRTGRSTSRGPRDPASPGSVQSSAWGRESTTTAGTARERSDRERSESQVRKTSERRGVVPAPLATPAPMQLVANKAGDLKVIKDERQLKKEAAARELEERRKSLARRPSAPPILHPDELSPAPTRTPGFDGLTNRATASPAFQQTQQPAAATDEILLPSSTFVPTFRAKDLPQRSASVDPMSAGSARSMYANRGGSGQPHIGLPATPKAMRLVLESDSSKLAQHNPMPPIPSTFAQTSPPLTGYSNQPSPKRMSPKRSEHPEVIPEVEPPLKSPALLLPSTVYTPPPPATTRPPIQRSASAPPRDLSPPQGSSFSNLRGGHVQRKPSIGGEGGHSSMMPARRPSVDAGNIPPPPPPPPPAPPMLKELQHLAVPPPPPPAPLPHQAGKPPVVYGGSSGLIEIVMEGDDEKPQEPAESNVVPPQPTSTRNGHHRGRSSIDNSIGARLSRATERMRSASRNRTRDGNTSNIAGLSRTKSPEIQVLAPYESVPSMPQQLSYQQQLQMRDQMRSPPLQQQQQQQQQGQLPQSQYNQQAYQAQLQQHHQQQQERMRQQQDEFRTGLHHSEMI
ncbi:hypothetical protein QBC46DRAFT_414819 [Diplogelasinospora grovesii]|uniref:Gem-associated protein 5 TPR domain-containing protein n=1 Tax=Diplogelasinospora grovesii TaxID=303347 RepID=A0AAN6SAJ7_9PEZI|nr:hypothetical protein QBC46DRAFT_414819 [Diplogelasinospora grovesii]